MRFVFYDTETTGTDTVFDQILQFAAICTDENFNELERLEIRSQLLPYKVASPGAVKVNGVSVAQLHDPKLPSHYAMVRTIQEKLRSWSPAIFIGYNSIGFDENIFRQALYQTLHPPYLTNTGGNCRSDALRMAQAASLFAPNVLAIPVNEKGGFVFKLDQLAPANGFNEHDAHDALGDVLATIHICKLLRDRAPALWGTFLRFSKKLAVQAHLRQEAIVSISEFYFNRPYSWLVAAIGRNPENEAEIAVVDLSQEPEALLELNDIDLAVYVNKSPKPVRWVRSNACPIIMPAEHAPEIAIAKKIPTDELRRRSEFFRKDRRLAERLIAALTSGREVREPGIHVEQKIYDGFFSNGDQALMAEFHELPWEQRLDVCRRFVDPRLQQIGLRLIFVEAPHALPQRLRQQHQSEFAGRTTGEAAEWMTLPKAIQETEDMLNSADEQAKPFLVAYRDYLTNRLQQDVALLA
jgi:exodeoxyribonuclease-1